MKREILYTEPVVSEMVDSGEEYLSKFKFPNAEIEVTSLPEGPRHLKYYSYGPLVVLQILKMIKKAERDNFDGVIIGCFYDPGLREAREIAEQVVVTAPAEASMHIASTLGQRFSIIVTENKTVPLMRENVIKYGFFGS